ncbi:MAG TPA: VIT and VWA domain-containing protein [Blastocatellia bacterium]|nr:VIT and VWA domain-containing protein [Blastocatellia bacterium]
MKPKLVVSFLLIAAALIVAYVAISKVSASATRKPLAAAGKLTQGSLQVIDPEKGVVAAECPLKHTDVKAEISGFLARVVVTQEFENPLKDKIEAVYAFPLPQNAAVDDMTMRIGERSVRGKIKMREEARAIYEDAKKTGHVASLLDQERPNIFTQSVANIMPGEKVSITISYVEQLKYGNGSYEFVFPMVVGPRYIPGQPTGKQGGGWAPDTNQVPDASRVTPPVAPEGTRAGHDISLEVAVDAGVPIDTLKSVMHDVDVERATDHSAFVQLKDKAEIPNKDFILKYDVAGKNIEDALLVHRASDKGFFSMIIQPPERVAPADITPKELVFVLDTSGSMWGFPIEKAKECMRLALDGLNPRDTFNLITFSGSTEILFPKPVPATAANISKAQEFLAVRSGGGGTEMMQAIRAALDPSDVQDHVRVVCFMTDGYVGNDMEIIAEIQRHPQARVFSFGIGNAVNRFLLDKMAEQGRGEVEYVTLADDGSAAARRFYERVRNPLLTDISIDWGGLQVQETYPKRIPDLFDVKPVVISGSYVGGGRGTIKLKGKLGGRDFVREIPVELPASERRHDVLATLWARNKIDDLMSLDYGGLQRGETQPEVRDAITQLGLEYRLMTQFTSFVAVEEMTVTDGGQPRRVDVPVEMPAGVSREGVFGSRAKDQPFERLQLSATLQTRASAPEGPHRDSRKAKPERKPGLGSGSGPGAGGAKGTAQAGGVGNTPSGVNDSITPPPPKLTAEEQEKRRVLSKLHPSLAAIVQRLKDKNSSPGPEEVKLVRNGKVEIQLWLEDKSTGTLKQLKDLGFEIVAEPKSGRMLIGRIPIASLQSLTQLTAVRYASPTVN